MEWMDSPWAILERECDCEECFLASQLPLDLDSEDGRLAGLLFLEGLD